MGVKILILKEIKSQIVSYIHVSFNSFEKRLMFDLELKRPLSRFSDEYTVRGNVGRIFITSF